jgi:hypothetical protein
MCLPRLPDEALLDTLDTNPPRYMDRIVECMNALAPLVDRAGVGSIREAFSGIQRFVERHKSDNYEQSKKSLRDFLMNHRPCEAFSNSALFFAAVRSEPWIRLPDYFDLGHRLLAAIPDPINASLFLNTSEHLRVLLSFLSKSSGEAVVLASLFPLHRLYGQLLVFCSLVRQPNSASLKFAPREFSESLDAKVQLIGELIEKWEVFENMRRAGNQLHCALAALSVDRVGARFRGYAKKPPLPSLSRVLEEQKQLLERLRRAGKEAEAAKIVPNA